MLEPAPDEPVQRETDPVPLGHSGLTDFLVEDPACSEVSHEALQEAVRSLIRERDYLRNIRDVQQVDHASELAKHRAYEIELTRERDALLKDRDAWRARAAHAEMGFLRRLTHAVKRRLRKLKLRLRSAVGRG